jgi:hypothetical protein
VVVNPTVRSLFHRTLTHSTDITPAHLILLGH